MKEQENLFYHSWYEKKTQAELEYFQQHYIRFSYSSDGKQIIFPSKFIELKPRKELTHGDFGKTRDKHLIKGSIIGNCLNSPNQIWKYNMINKEFLKYVLGLNFYNYKETKFDYLIPLLKNIWEQ